MAGALDGIMVLDFTRAYSGPFCTLMLRDLGARVIKVELPGSGDNVRKDYPLTAGGEGGTFIILNRGKKSITLNLKSDKGREICKKLVARADVLLENYSPGTMAKLGLGHEELCRSNPRLIYASISGYGQTGPYRDRVSYDPMGQAMGGITSVTGFPDSPPIKCGVSIADFSTGLYTTIAILAALHHRQKTGQGQYIDMSIQDCVWLLTAIEYSPPYFLTGKALPRLGNSHPAMAPGNLYMAKDGPVLISTSGHSQVLAFYKAIGREDLWNTPFTSDQSERYKYKPQIDALVGEWASSRTVAEVLKILREADIPCAPVPSFDQVCNDPQLISRDMIIEVEQPKSGPVKVPGSLFKMSRTPGNVKYPAPALGEHNREILAEALGYTEEEIEKLSGEGVI